MTHNIPMMTTPIPDSTDFNLDAVLPEGELFDELVARRQAMKKMITACEEEIKNADAKLGAALDFVGQRNVISRGLVVSRREGSKPRETLDPVLLLEAGVSPEQLHKGTKLGKPGKPTIAIRALKEKDEDEQS